MNNFELKSVHNWGDKSGDNKITQRHWRQIFAFLREMTSDNKCWGV